MPIEKHEPLLYRKLSAREHDKDCRAGQVLEQGFQEECSCEPTQVVTEKMRIAGFESEAWGRIKNSGMSCKEAADCVEGIFVTMLAAAPSPATPEAEGPNVVVPRALFTKALDFIQGRIMFSANDIAELVQGLNRNARNSQVASPPAAPKPTEKSKLPGSFDAMDWVREWLETIKKNPTIPTDEGTMLAWFANAIMAGWDEHARRYPVQAAAQEQKVVSAHLLREKLLTLINDWCPTKAPVDRVYFADAAVKVLLPLFASPIPASGWIIMVPRDTAEVTGSSPVPPTIKSMTYVGFSPSALLHSLHTHTYIYIQAD